MRELFGRLVRFREKPQLTPAMRVEIARLGLALDYFQHVAESQGLEACQGLLEYEARAKALFDQWYPRLRAFAEARRAARLGSAGDSVGGIEAATLRMLAPKIQQLRAKPDERGHRAALFIAPRHMLPALEADWPSAFRHAVYLTPEEAAEWWSACESDALEQLHLWCVEYRWDAQVNPSADTYWLRDSQVSLPTEGTPVLVEWGECSGPLAAEAGAELWVIDKTGCERFVQRIGHEVS